MNENKIIIDGLKAYLPVVKAWILNYHRNHSLESRIVAELKFTRLQNYYSRKFLDTARVVFVDQVEMVPLQKLGILGFEEFENLDAAGVTYLNTFYINKDYASFESIFFHELVHIVQWSFLGIDNFLLLYGIGLKKYGYQQSPLEQQAYLLQERFDQSSAAFDVEFQIIPSLKELLKEIS